MVSVPPRARSFDAHAAVYERGRPGWPAAAIDALAMRLGLGEESVVLDLAAGTGKLTRMLVPRFGTVIAVEPLDGMRAVLERVVPGARALAGTAEAIPLPDASVDAVVIAEAIHWFDLRAALEEVARVLRPGGGVAVLYNRTVIDHERHPWQREIDVTFEAHRMPSDGIDPHDAERWTTALTERFGAVRQEIFEHARTRDRAGMLDLYASYSVIASLPPTRREAALAALRDVLERNGVTSSEIRYRTELTTARRT